MPWSSQESLDFPMAGRIRIRVPLNNACLAACDFQKFLTQEMNRFFRMLLLCLLVAALPLQGIAATMQAACGPAKDHGIADHGLAASHGQHQEQHQHHGGARDAGPADSHAAAQAAVASDSPSGDQEHHSKCSVCAYCCVGAAAPPGAAVSEPAHASPLPVIVPAAPLLVGIVSSGLDRPPKRMTA